MNNTSNWIVAALLALVSPLVQGQPQTAVHDFNNGCGSGWNEPIVPDGIKRLGIDFSAACARHDNCYHTCNRGGTYYGQAACRQTDRKSRARQRLACDNAFLADMKSQCDKLTGQSKTACKGTAVVYRVAVAAGGATAYQGRHIPDDYADYLLSEAANRFNLDGLDIDISRLLAIPDFAAANALAFKVAGGAPVVVATARRPIQASRGAVASAGLKVRSLLSYGSLDLTAASVGGGRFSLESVKAHWNLDLSKLRQESKLEAAQ
jgi:hypothetical protein